MQSNFDGDAMMSNFEELLCCSLILKGCNTVV